MNTHHNSTCSSPDTSSDFSDGEGTLVCPPYVIERRFVIGERLGDGQFSTVYKAKWNKLGEKIAVKRTEISRKVVIDKN